MADYGGYDDSAYGGSYGGYAGGPPPPGGGGGGYAGTYGAPPPRGGPPPPAAGGYSGYPGYGPPQMGGPPGGPYDPRGVKSGPPSFAQDSPLDAEVAAVLHEIRSELGTFDASPDYSSQYRNAKRLLQCEVVKLENNIDPEWLELDIEKQIKLVKKVLIPQFRHPRFNFVGKIIGPKGVTLQNIAKVFKCHVYVLGRGSTRDRAKEQELLASGDPQYSHYGGPLHVKVETTAPPALAYKRITGVLEVLKQLINPVKDTYIEGITPEECKDGGASKNEHEGIEEKDEPVEQFNSDDFVHKNGGGNNDRGGRGGGGRGRGGRGGGGGNVDPYRGPPSVGLSGGPMRGGHRGGGGGPPRGRGFGGGRGGPRGGGGRGGPPRFQPY